jgi:hypothetical protein
LNRGEETPASLHKGMHKTLFVEKIEPFCFLNELVAIVRTKLQRNSVLGRKSIPNPVWCGGEDDNVRFSSSLCF